VPNSRLETLQRVFAANPQFRADKQPSWRFMLPDPPRLTTPDFVGDDFIEGMLE
jgi:hypothetical protein